MTMPVPVVVKFYGLWLLSSIMTGCMFLFMTSHADLLADDLVRSFPVGAVEPHPHGQRQQDAGYPRSGHPCALLPARRHRGLAADSQGHQVLQVKRGAHFQDMPGGRGLLV
jgi:hypothetical protein